MKQLIYFAYQQALSSIFPVFIFITLAISKLIHIPYIHRYDFILIMFLLIQFIMYITGMETKDEIKVIALFHLIGLALEIYKVHMGSWSYPEVAYTKIFGVPLYSGFMYASVASYMIQAWRRLELQLYGWPRPLFTISIGLSIYLNFFIHHFIYDFRWILKGILIIIFLKTYVEFTVKGRQYKMPLVLSFFLIGFFIWIAENIATFLGAWQYPDQRIIWHIVSIGKISSWSLLVIISFIIVAQLKHVKANISKNKKTYVA